VRTASEQGRRISALDDYRKTHHVVLVEKYENDVYDPAAIKEEQGFAVLSDDPKVTGSKRRTLYGIPRDEWNAMEAERLAEGNAFGADEEGQKAVGSGVKQFKSETTVGGRESLSETLRALQAKE